ncbi:MAG TPA: amidohydrolase family protein, partial [Bacteroidia bacterium]|nr:amidohydrolase family protein [Bacteroidia bacterium]
MRIISADYIFPVASSPVKNGLIVIDDDGTIKDVLEPTASIEKSNIETHKGLIVPGFVNAHCHLELSHLKGKLKEKTKLTGFVSEILSKRNHFSIDDIKSALKAAEQEMIGNGIVAVGDISNTNHTFEQKQRKNLSYHTFIEVFDINPKNAQPFFDSAASLQSEFP